MTAVDVNMNPPYETDDKIEQRYLQSLKDAEEKRLSSPCNNPIGHAIAVNRYQRNQFHYYQYLRETQVERNQEADNLAESLQIGFDEYQPRYWAKIAATRLSHARQMARVCSSRRRARKQALPNVWTHHDWLKCLEYWHYSCAVCGKQLRDLFKNIEPHADHWIAITDPRPDNPGTVRSNMICLCSPCNESKCNSSPDEWLKKKYGTRLANITLKRITDYFDWIVQQK